MITIEKLSCNIITIMILFLMNKKLVIFNDGDDDDHNHGHKPEELSIESTHMFMLKGAIMKKVAISWQSLRAMYHVIVDS